MVEFSRLWLYHRESMGNVVSYESIPFWCVFFRIGYKCSAKCSHDSNNFFRIFHFLHVGQSIRSINLQLFRLEAKNTEKQNVPSARTTHSRTPQLVLLVLRWKFKAKNTKSKSNKIEMCLPPHFASTIDVCMCDRVCVSEWVCVCEIRITFFSFAHTTLWSTVINDKVKYMRSRHPIA